MTNVSHAAMKGSVSRFDGGELGTAGHDGRGVRRGGEDRWVRQLGGIGPSGMVSAFPDRRPAMESARQQRLGHLAVRGDSVLCPNRPVRFPVGDAPRPVVSVLEGSTPQPPQLVDDRIQALTLD